MPEGDTVWLAGRSLNTALWGRVLTRTDFRIPQLAAIDLSGRSVIEVVSRGKHLLTRIEGGTTLHTHFRMDGLAHLRSRSPLGGRPQLASQGGVVQQRMGCRWLPHASGPPASDS